MSSSNFQDFPGPASKFQDFPGLEKGFFWNSRIFQDFQDLCKLYLTGITFLIVKISFHFSYLCDLLDELLGDIFRIKFGSELELEWGLFTNILIQDLKVTTNI